MTITITQWSAPQYADAPMGQDGVIYSWCTFGLLRCSHCRTLWAWRPMVDEAGRLRWGVWRAEEMQASVRGNFSPKGYIFRAARVQCVEPECMDADPILLGEAILTHEGRWVRLPPVR